MEDQPTIKQLEYAKDIAYELGLELPLERTRENIGNFIQKNVQAYREALGREKWASRHDKGGKV